MLSIQQLLNPSEPVTANRTRQLSEQEGRASSQGVDEGSGPGVEGSGPGVEGLGSRAEDPSTGEVSG